MPDWNSAANGRKYGHVVRVSVVRGGGFGGLIRSSTADTERLSPRDGEKLAALVEQAGLSGARTPPEPGEPGPDRFTYAVTVEDKGQTWRATYSERSLPGEVRNLITWVSSIGGHEDDIRPPGGQ
jgi:hypothetical protein